MGIYEYLNEAVKAEINKEIKNKLNAEDIEAWKEGIADEYYSIMYDECMRMIYSNPQYKEYEVCEDVIRDLAEELAENDIDKFIEYCVENDDDPYNVCIAKWLNQNGCSYGGILNDDTIEELINGGYIVKK